MIRPLRQVHRWTFAVLAPLLAAVLALALASRHAPPAAADTAGSGLALPDPRNVQTGIGVAFLGRWAEIRTGDMDGAAYVVVTEREPDIAPDVHLYWCPNEPPVGEGALPAGSLHIGTLGGRARLAFPLPSGAEPGTGALALFSLADRRTLVAAPFELR